MTEDILFQAPKALIARTKVIMLPVDGSRDSGRAASVAFELAHITKGKLLIVHIINVGAVQQIAKMSSTDSLLVLRQYMENGKNLLENYRAAAAEYRLDIELILDQGSPPQRIVQLARERRVDVIIIGSRGASGEDRGSVGSTTERVVRDADCAVLVIKIPR
ncbi:MAG: universal stress protein [Candidatus Thorarchaeota archaeon]|nr:universal stress protein [Candidatus Thorarchaeota archaeon]